MSVCIAVCCGGGRSWHNEWIPSAGCYQTNSSTTADCCSCVTWVQHQTSDYYVISQETNCSCCTAAYLFTYCCLLLPNICGDCVALFYGQFLYLIGQSFSKPPMPTHHRLFSESPTFGETHHYLLQGSVVTFFSCGR